MHNEQNLKNTPEYRSGMFRIVSCPVCGHPTLDMYWICAHCGWEYDNELQTEDEESPGNGMSLRAYRELYQVGGTGMARVGKDRWVANLHPRNIPVTKATLRKMLSLYDDRLSWALCCALAIGEDHPHFQEWLTKACFHLQTLTSFVYIGPYPDGGPYFTRRAMKLPEKYYAKAFDAFCESPEECRDRLESLRNEDAELFPNGITGELVDSTFAKYLAVKRYTLPMLTNTSEFNYFSFYRHILLYVVEHDTHPEFPVLDTGYKYPPLPGMSECDIDFDY